MDYNKVARDILENIGGGKNVVSAAHCATRLRLVIADNKLVNKSKLENIDGVKGVFEASGQLQVIIGTGTVNKVYDEFLKEGGIEAATKEEVKQAAANKQNIFIRLIKTLGDVFVPIIPAIVACGILMGLLEGLTQIPALSGMTENNFYVLFHAISNAAFAFLPVLIAVSASKVFKCNTLLAAVMGIIMVHPDFLNAWNAGAENASEYILFAIGDFEVKLMGLQGHVIPVVLSIWIMSLLERRLHKVVPAVIDLFVTPLVTLLVTATATMLVIGPVFSTVENWVLDACEWFIHIPYGFGGLIIGAVYALTVVCGLHHMYNAIEAGLISATGFNPWMPIATCVNTAQGAACLAVAVKTKDKKLRSVAYPAALSAYLGITEPAIFGVNLRFKRPLIAGCIGGAVGGWLVALLGVEANAYGVTGIFGILITMFNLRNLLLYLLGIVVASAVAFVVSFFLHHDLEALAENEIAAPVKGRAIPLSKVNDATFSQGVLGRGMAVIPRMNIFTGNALVYAPFDGEVSTLFETHHAIGLTGNGAEVLIHIGINTVELDGKYFTPLVKEGDKVVRGQPLIRFNARKIKKAGYDITTPVIVTNSDDYTEVSMQQKPYTHLETKCLICVK